MNFLYVDSCSEQLFVLGYNEGKIAYQTSNGNKRHNSVLLPCVDKVLEEINLTIDKVQNIACVQGAGSFTGIRLGVTTCNGLAFACGANRVPMNTFESVAYNISKKILVAIDARHGNYYGGEYNCGKQIKLGNYTEEDLKNFDGEVIVWQGVRNIQNIVDIVLEKIENQEFVQMFVPMYLKKSQAERELQC